MGSYTSKLFSHNNEHESKSKSHNNATTNPCGVEKIRMCTPPMAKRKLGTDPRSATMGLVRTPIEVTGTPPGLTRRVASALPKYLQGKMYLETDFDAVMPVTTPEKCISDPRSPNVSQQRTPIMVKPADGYVSPVITVNQAPSMNTPMGVVAPVSALDPRSPAIDFDRTPILKQKSADRAAASFEEINLPIAESKNGNTILLYCETTTDYNIPEIQTISGNFSGSNESSGLENRRNANDDESSKDSTSRPVSSDETDDSSENEEQITVIRNTKILSSYHPDAISTRTEDKIFGTDDDDDDDVVVVVGVEANDECDESFGKKLDNDISEMINAVMQNTIEEQKILTNNDKIKVWRDSVSPSIDEEIKNAARRTSEEIIIEFDDETMTTTATKKNSNIVNAVKVTAKIDDEKSRNQMRKKKSQQQQQQQLNGENQPEERKIFNEGKNQMDATLNRTPLGNRSNNHKQRQIVSAKSPQQLLRNKGLSARTIQQENTPPTERFVPKSKPHGIQWDPDTTVII